jgi:serine/threonine protein kinase/Tol biopolymer transport system component
MASGEDMVVPTHDSPIREGHSPVNAPNWDRVKQVFQRALGRPDHEWHAYVREQCGGDEALQAEVESLLSAHERAGSFADQPAVELLNELAHSQALTSLDRVVQPGDRFGGYEIESYIGAGGMADVYRARDTTLGRQVALKVLPSIWMTDFEHVARFNREARILAALNHPLIAAIYGVERSDDISALVLELVDGETLAERIARSPLSVNEALPIARQIAEALAAAHEKGIVHRDLKPRNIKLTPTGTVKVLDFGLSKSVRDDGPATSASAALSAGDTRPGTVVGTTAYMSPEQARGEEVDKRTDIWAFGCVLYEMLTGTTAIDGDGASDTLAAVLRGEPDWTRLPLSLPQRIRRLIQSCLERNRAARIADVSTVMYVLTEVEVNPETPVSPFVATRVERGWRWAAVAAVVGLLTVIAFFASPKTPRDTQTFRFQVPPPGTTLAEYLSISPDGRHLAFVADVNGATRLWIRELDALDAREIRDTDGAAYPFWSPDSAYVGFFAQGQLRKVAATGGLAHVICDAPNSRGGSWSRDGIILFTPNPLGPIFSVSAAGGMSTALTKVLETGNVTGHRFPSFLPDGRHFLYLLASDKPDVAGLYVRSLDGNVNVRIAPNKTNGVFVPMTGSPFTGHVLFRRDDDTLMALPFDSRSLRPTGEAVPLAEQVPTTWALGHGEFSASANGTLAYRSGYTVEQRELAWMDRSGMRIATVSKPGPYLDFAMSPDEQTAAVTVANGSSEEIWLQDLRTDHMSRFTFRPGLNNLAVWSPDGRRLAFMFQPAGTYFFDIFEKPVGGASSEEFIFRTTLGAAHDWSPDGKWILYTQTSGSTRSDLWLFPTGGDRKPVPYLQTPFDETNAKFSPDGKWIAYQSNESGQYQIYIQPFPPTGAKWQVSSAGGEYPRWRRDGSELFYMAPNFRLMTVSLVLGTTVNAGPPQPLFQVSVIGNSPGDIPFGVEPSHDGKRFLVSVPATDKVVPVQPITVVTNFDGASRK